MSKYVELSFIEVIQPFFMNGTNMGTKINAAIKGARLFKNVETQEVEIYFKEKWSTIGMGNICSSDYKELPEDLASLVEDQAPAHPRARKEPVNMSAAYATQAASFDPNDDSPEAHRARVRAASANANRPNPLVAQNDALIQQARMDAMGIKHGAQVSIPTMPEVGQTGQTRNVRGKPKAISHEGMRAQVAAEIKDPNA